MIDRWRTGLKSWLSFPVISKQPFMEAWTHLCRSYNQVYWCTRGTAVAGGEKVWAWLFSCFEPPRVRAWPSVSEPFWCKCGGKGQRRNRDVHITNTHTHHSIVADTSIMCVDICVCTARSAQRDPPRTCAWSGGDFNLAGSYACKVEVPPTSSFQVGGGLQLSRHGCLLSWSPPHFKQKSGGVHAELT